MCGLRVAAVSALCFAVMGAFCRLIHNTTTAFGKRTLPAGRLQRSGRRWQAKCLQSGECFRMVCRVAFDGCGASDSRQRRRMKRCGFRTCLSLCESLQIRRRRHRTWVYDDDGNIVTGVMSECAPLVSSFCLFIFINFVRPHPPPGRYPGNRPAEKQAYKGESDYMVHIAFAF